MINKQIKEKCFCENGKAWQVLFEENRYYATDGKLPSYIIRKGQGQMLSECPVCEGKSFFTIRLDK